MSDEQAAAARKAFADATAAKHIKASVPPGPATATGVDPFAGGAGGKLYQRNPAAGIDDEASALAMLNSRSPASDAARDHNGPMSPHASTDGGEGELLRRQSTRGKRQSPGYPQQQPLRDQYGNYLTPQIPVPSRTAQPPPMRPQEPPNYNSFPAPPAASSTPVGAVRQGSPASQQRAPRYELPPGQPRGAQDPSPPAPTRKSPSPEQRSRSNTATSYPEGF